MAHFIYIPVWTKITKYSLIFILKVILFCLSYCVNKIYRWDKFYFFFSFSNLLYISVVLHFSIIGMPFFFSWSDSFRSYEVACKMYLLIFFFPSYFIMTKKAYFILNEKRILFRFLIHCSFINLNNNNKKKYGLN